MYKGDWKDGLEHGAEMLVFADGDTMECGWKKDTVSDEGRRYLIVEYYSNQLLCEVTWILRQLHDHHLNKQVDGSVQRRRP